MAIAFRAAGTASAGASSCTPGLPTGTVENDVLVCVASATGNTAFTWPAGWTEVAANNMSGTRRMEVRWKRAGASESAPTISYGAANVILAQIVGYSGCVTTGSPVDQVSSVTNQTTTTLTYAAVTPTVADTELVLAGSIASNVTVSGYSGSNPAPTERFDSGTTTGSTASVHLASGAKTDTTSSGSRTATRGGGTLASGTLQFGLLPVAAGTTETLTAGDASADAAALAVAAGQTAGDAPSDASAPSAVAVTPAGDATADAAGVAAIVEVGPGDATADGTEVGAGQGESVSPGDATADAPEVVAAITASQVAGDADADGAGLFSAVTLVYGDAVADGIVPVAVVALEPGEAVADGAAPVGVIPVTAVGLIEGSGGVTAGAEGSGGLAGLIEHVGAVTSAIE